jgi:CubicO group peptidase (beta-lactamase class C family)
MRTALVFTLLLGIAVPAFSSDASPQEVRQLFAAYDKPNSPGCSVGVVRDGKFLYRESYGKASLELGVPLTSRSVFYMASVSKQFTAASVVLAAEQGYLALDDDVRKYIPELPDYGHPITLRQMLHHTSGLRDFLSLVYLSGRDISDLASSGEVLKLIARQKGLNNVPGAEFIYSNSNYFLLGVVIQRATRKSLAKFAALNIFRPLGMAHTLFYDDNTLVVPGRVAAYDPGEDGKFKVDWSTTYDIVGGGGLMSTVDDLLLWDNNFYADKLGKAGLIKELETRGVLNDGKQINYAMGLWLGTYRGAPTVEHSGGTFGYRTELLRFPEQHFTVIALCNVANANVESLSRQVAALYLGGILQPEPSAVVNATLPDPAPFAGTYLDPRTHVVYTFTVVDGKLTAWGSVLRRFGPNQFNDLVGNPITFEEKSGVMSARLDLDGETYFNGGRVQDIQLTPSALEAFAGEYRSEELNANYKLAVEQGSLILRNRDQAPLKLNPISTAEFQTGDLGTIVFHTDTRHRISGLTLFSQAARGIEFRKTK